jgi:hypothetical protein
MEEQAPLSLELRTIKKRQRVKGGIAALAVGVVALGISIYFFLTPGAMVVAIFTLAVGLGLTGTGAYMLRKAATQRW